MSNYVKGVLVGAGYMGTEYYKVIRDIGEHVTVISRGKENAAKFEALFDKEVLIGGVDRALLKIKNMPEYAIVACNVSELARVTISLMEYGIKKILVEKPAGINKSEIGYIVDIAKKTSSSVYVAYNRRFYVSVNKLLECIEEDGGVRSYFFEFTELGYKLRHADKPICERDSWLLANSTHVIDLAFFLGGIPKEINARVAGNTDWHSGPAIYTGCGESQNGALFSYMANWNAPGRWSVEILTDKRRFYLRPLEELQVQELGSFQVNHVELEDELDRKYKPGIYKLVDAFLHNVYDKRLLPIEQHIINEEIYEIIQNGTDLRY